MSNKISRWWTDLCLNGAHLPYLHDPVTNKPSITLLFPYITFVIAFISVILLHIWPSLLVATITSIVLWCIATVFYMIRKLNKAKIDLQNQSIELDNGESNEDS